MFRLLWWFGSFAYAGAEAEEAEVEFQLGLSAYTAGDFDLALSRFLASNRLAPNPAVAYNIARCYAKTERYAESYRWYTVAAQSLDTEEGQRAIQSGLEAIVPRVVVFDLVTEPPGADVYVDSKDYGVVGTTPLRLALAPTDASRTFVFALEGHEEVVIADVRGERGQLAPVRATLKPVVGKVAIRGAEGGEVHLGTPSGPVVCTAPCDAELPPGNRILYVRRPGYRDSVLQLDVTANETTEASVELVPNTGSLLVQASERGALVQIDGVAAGFTPTVVQNVPVGERVVRVVRPGFEPFEQVVTVETDRQVELPPIALLPSDEITAVSRRAEQAALSPSSVTVITRAELEAFRYPTLYEALRGVRGFAMTQDSVYGIATVRGFGQQNDFNNKLLVLSDGTVMNDNYGGASFLTYDGMVDTDLVEQLEVVRGPGSVLYGAGAVAGVLNIVGAPRTAAEGATVRVGGYDRAFFGTGRVHEQLSDQFGFRAELSGAASQGRSETIDPKGDPPPISVSGVERFEGYTTAGRLWMGKATTAQWFYTMRKQYIPTGAYTVNYGDSNDSWWNDRRGMVELRVEPKLTEATSLFTRAFGTYSWFDGSYPFVDYLLFEKFSGANGGAETRLITEPSRAVRLQLGARGTVSPVLSMTGDYLPEVGADERYLDESDLIWTASAFGVLDLQPVQAVALSLGVRGDYWSTFGFAPSPRLAAVLQPTDRDVIKLLVGRAFRAPSFFEIAYNSPGVQARSDYAGAVLQPEVVWSGEAEVTHRFGPLWTVLVAGHGSQADQLIETLPTVGVDERFVTGNSDLQIRTVGTDVEVRRAFQAGILASAFYSWLDARYDDGEAVPNAPQHHAAFKVVFPISAPELRIALRANLEGTRRINLVSEERTDLALVADLVLSGEAPELGLDYAVGMYNVLDMDYEQPLTDTFPLRTMPQPGRSAMFNLTKRF